MRPGSKISVWGVFEREKVVGGIKTISGRRYREKQSGGGTENTTVLTSETRTA